MTFIEDNELPQQISRLDGPLDRPRVGNIEVDRVAGLTYREFREVAEMCKLVAQARHGLPPFLRGNAADCVMLAIKALRWRLEPTWVMENAYITKTDGIINYNNFIFSAIINASGLLKGRPRYIYSGEGDERICTVSAVFKGETLAHEISTPPLRMCRKNSPLWKEFPDQQLGYFAIRAWGRRHMPEILGGVYSRDEFDDTTQDAIETPASPRLMDRLPGKLAGTGFAANVVDNGLAQAAEQAIAAEATRKAGQAPQEAAGEPEPPRPPPPPPEPERVPEPPKGPTTPEEYALYAEQWISRGQNPDDLEARWDSEIEERRALRVPVTVRRALQTLVTDRCLELRKIKRKG